MRSQRRRKWQLAFVGILGTGAAISPGSLMADASTGPSSSSTGSTALAVLGSVADTAGNRTSIVINDFGAIWRAAGLPFPPTLHEVGTKAGSSATYQMAGGSPAGSLLWEDMFTYPSPLGYPALALDGELEVGQTIHDLSEVWGPITQPAVLKAFQKIKPHTKMVGTDLVLDLGSQFVLRPAPFDQDLLGTRFVAIPKAGGRLVTGGLQASSSAVTALVNGASVVHPLSHDPAVSVVLSGLGPNFDSLAMGTGFIGAPNDIFHGDSPAARAELERISGLSHLHGGPVMVGVAYTKGAPQAEPVVAAALYPSPADAQEAVKTVARYTAAGNSLQTNMPYQQLWRVDRTTAHDSLVVMDLTTKSPGSVTRALIRYDFPLFWSP